MEIEIKNTILKDVWDIQRAKKVLEICGLSSEGVLNLNQKDKGLIEKEITLYLWKKINEQFPKINKFCHGRTGGFNLCEERNYKTPIINIHGSFYLQLISLNNKNNWCWESIDLEPYRFEFNEEGYFQNLLIDGMNKAILSGNAKKETFEKMINALNETKTKESFITIQTKGKDLGKVDLKQIETKII
jgi:hypothetical protein